MKYMFPSKSFRFRRRGPKSSDLQFLFEILQNAGGRQRFYTAGQPAAEAVSRQAQCPCKKALPAQIFGGGGRTHRAGEVKAGRRAHALL